MNLPSSPLSFSTLAHIRSSSLCVRLPFPLFPSPPLLSSAQLRSYYACSAQLGSSFCSALLLGNNGFGALCSRILAFEVIPSTEAAVYMGIDVGTCDSNNLTSLVLPSAKQSECWKYTSFLLTVYEIKLERPTCEQRKTIATCSVVHTTGRGAEQFLI